MAVASAIGSMPGDDVAEAVNLVLGELPELPHLPELPGRGPHAGMTGRSLAIVAELGFDLQPDGWRLTDSPGIDHRRAQSLLAQDLDVLEELTQGYDGPLKVQVAGPWTLAATVEKPRGDRVLGDHGARRDLAQALAEGVRVHLRDLARRVPGATFLVQVDEPALPAVMAAQIPTASGFGRHRAVDAPRASAALEDVFAAITEAGATPVAHCCAADPPIALLRGAGARIVSVDLLAMKADAWEPLAEALDAGERAMLGVVPSLETDAGDVPARVERLLGMIGFSLPEVAEQLVLTPTCGLAGASPRYAREALALVRTSASRLS